MAARKLQTEIDRTLKKVAEGVELFESIYEKMANSTNQTQKEKLEMDLKTQIKKLQRLRDQIKTWAASNDIKDKSALLENRKLIETQMEKFKACEKEMKTKAFSKEGLIASAKLDPKAQEKMAVTHWVREQVEALANQIEQTEAEIEGMQATGGKKKSKAGAGAAAERLEELESLNERRKWHVNRLEIILRLLDNGTMPTEKVQALKDDVEFFVESNANDDFEEDDGIYDDLNLDEEEEKFGIAPDPESSDESDEASEDLPPRTPSKKHEDKEEATTKREGSPVLKKSSISLNVRKSSTSTTDSSKPQSISNILKSTASAPAPAPAPRQPPQMPTLKYATAAAAALAPPASNNAQTTPASSAVPPTPSLSNATSASITPSTSQATTALDHITSSPSLTHPSVTSPLLSSTSASVQPIDGSMYSHTGSPSLSESVSASASGPAATSSSPQSRNASVPPARAGSQSPGPVQMLATESQMTATPANTNGTSPTSQQPAGAQETPQQSASAAGPSPLPQQLQPIPQASVSGLSADSSPLPPPATAQPQYPPGMKVVAHTEPQQMQIPQQNQQTQAAAGAQRPESAGQALHPQFQAPQKSGPNAFPNSLSDLVSSFENVKQKAAHRMNNLDQVHKLLEGGYSSIPQPQDTEKPKYYVPRNPFPTPSYYPQTPNPVLSTAGLFSQLDVETLFYVFYYHPGTYLQYLAAKELKRQSWRFHVKYLTWFQRHSEPQAITEEYEQGVYVYFDWEGSWCQRKKSDFRFEYRYLSED